MRAKSFWMRTRRANCFRFLQSNSTGYEKAGIVFHDDYEKEPTTSGWYVNETISADERDDKLTPVVRWNVTRPSTEDLKGKLGDQFAVQLKFGPPKPFHFPLAHASMGGNSFTTDYSNPVFSNLQYGGE